MEPRRSSEQPRHASRRSAALDGDRFTLRVKLLRGSGLPAADRNGASDPYVVLRAAERKWRSSTCPKTLEPVWNEECQLDWVSMPQLEAALAKGLPHSRSVQVVPNNDGAAAEQPTAQELCHLPVQRSGRVPRV